MKTQHTNAVNPSVIQTFSSPNDFFMPNPEADAADALETALSLLAQANSSISALMCHHEDNSLPTCAVLSNCLWAIQTQVSMAEQALVYMSFLSAQKDGASC